MKTNNENRRGYNNSGAGRDGKSFDKKNVKSFFKGIRGSARNNSETGNSKKIDNRFDKETHRTEFGEKRNFSDKRQFSNQDNKPWLNKDTHHSHSEKPRFVKKSELGERPASAPHFKKHFDKDERPRDGKLTLRKANETGYSKFVETRFDNKKGNVTFRKRHNSDEYDPNAKYSKKKQLEYKQNYVDPTKPIRLNKFLANAGICSRREADEYIQAGVISVNGVTISELGAKVLITDNVMFHNQPVRIEKKIYILLNKPKDCVTTAEDTHSRLTVLDIVKNACSERIYPVGRLDRNTTGVLLLTNDGDLASKLMHPKYDKKKIYHVGLDRDIEKEDFEAILSGIDLGDFTIKADALEFVKEDNMHEVGIEIHSGQNRVVRRIFEKLGYKITKLDRVFFAGLTKKQVPRGKYRFLTEKEVNILKMGAHE